VSHRLLTGQWDDDHHEGRAHAVGSRGATGLVERVTYQNAENGFCVLRVKARGQSELVTLVGHAAAISAGEWVTATGNWVNDRTHGQQFKAPFLKTSTPTSVEGIEKYLASGMIRGIGPVYAKKLLRAFGDQIRWSVEMSKNRKPDLDKYATG
jgi:exodeoxyribonuclease V alpha subunit